MSKTRTDVMQADSQPDQDGGSALDAPAAPLPSLPFAHLNLRCNPFGEVDLSQWARLAIVNVDRFVARLKQPGSAVQFLGDKGRGKTTHLLALKKRFPGARYVHVGENERPRIPHGHPLFVDEIQRLPPRQRRRLFRRPVSLVIGSHEDFHAELVQAGFDVETCYVGNGLDAERLRQILSRRIEAARRGPGRLPQVNLQTAQAMIDHFGDDLRAIQGQMYDLFQSLAGIQDV